MGEELRKDQLETISLRLDELERMMSRIPNPSLTALDRIEARIGSLDRGLSDHRDETRALARSVAAVLKTIMDMADGDEVVGRSGEELRKSPSETISSGQGSESGVERGA
jgi:hypothetical protein